MDNTPEPSDSYGWCLIPPTILARDDLSLRQKLIMGRILGLLGPKGYCYASNNWLGKQLGIAKGTMANLLSALAKQQVVRIEVIRNDNGQVLERRIYPKEVFTQSGKPIHEIMKRGIHDIVNKRVRDIRVEKSVKKRRADVGGPPATVPLFLSDDHPVVTPSSLGLTSPQQSMLPMEALSAPTVPSGRPPYLPGNFPLEHPVCQVLTRFADYWATISRQTLDVAIARAIKEIRSRLQTTSLPDLLSLVDLWFNPGLSWVTMAERGSFHTFIQPRAISELKGLKAGLPTTTFSQRGNGHLKPRPRADWQHIPPGETIL